MLFKLRNLITLLISILTFWVLASSAFADPVPSWISQTLLSKINQLPAGKSSDPLAMIYVCDPYCETVGEFFGKTEYRVASKDAQAEAQKPENQSHLRFILNPSLEGVDPSESHEPEEMASDPETIDNSGAPQTKEQQEAEAQAKADEAQAKAEEGNAQKEGGSQTNEAGEPIETQTPLFLGMHLDAFLGETSLTTSSNTDIASDQKTHGVIGGGLDFDIKNITPLWKGGLDLDFDLSYWGSSGATSKLNIGQTYSSSVFRGLIGALWQPAQSSWRLGVLIEGRQDSENASQDQAVAFSTKYFWASAGIQIQYGKTTLRMLKSLFSTVQDVDQYRGTSVSSSRLGFEAESCGALARILKGEFDVCGMGTLTNLSVNGSGNPVEPVFTASPTYSYSSWTIGIELKLAGISL